VNFSNGSCNCISGVCCARSTELTGKTDPVFDISRIAPDEPCILVPPSLLQIAEERSKETRGGSLPLEPDGLYSGLYVTLLDEIHSLLQDGDKQVKRPETRRGRLGLRQESTSIYC
jgi:hypothetical protein